MSNKKRVQDRANRKRIKRKQLKQNRIQSAAKRWADLSRRLDDLALMGGDGVMTSMTSTASGHVVTARRNLKNR